MKRNLVEDLEKLADAFYKNLEITSWEFGGVGLDPKRPFGNSDAASDILKILGGFTTVEIDGEMEFADKDVKYACDLYQKKLIPYLRMRWKERTAPTKEAAKYAQQLSSRTDSINNNINRTAQDLFDTIAELGKPALNLFTELQDFSRRWPDLKSRLEEKQKEDKRA